MNKTTVSPRLAKVQQFSLLFRMTCRVLLVGTALAGIGFLVPYLLSSQSSSSDQRDTYSIGVMVIGLLYLTYWGLGLWILERLFNVFVSGRVFDVESGRWLKRFGLWVGTCLLLPLLSRMAWDWANYGRLGAIRDAPLAPVVVCFVVGLFLMMLGWVLEEGSELQAEHDLTV